MKKRLLSAALALVMVCGLLPVTASAAATVTEIVPPKYDRIDESSEGLAVVNIGYSINNKKYGEWGFIDKTGREVAPCKYINLGVPVFHEGLAAVKGDTGEKYEGYAIYKWGFIDKTGKEVVPYKYTNYTEPVFHEGLAAVCVGEYNRKWGFIDKTGKEVVPCTLEYDVVGDFSEGLAAVKIGADIYGNGGKWGFIDKTGREVVPCTLEYDQVGKFFEGLAAVWLRDKGWGFIDTTGKEVVPCKYNYFGYADDTGNYLYPKFHNGVTVIDGSTGQIENGKTVYATGVIDTKGNVVVPFGKYNEIKRFIDGLAAVYAGNDKWGFIDTTGKEIVPCKYNMVEGFDQGLARVKLYNKWGFIDTTGKEVVPCKYDSVGDFSDGFAMVKLNDKWGFIDKTGKEVIPCTLEYDEVGDRSDGLTAVKTSNGWGCIDLQGNEVVPCQYGGVKLLSAGMVAVQLDKKWGIFRVEGLPTEPKPAPTPTPTPEPTTPTGYTAKATNDKLTVDGVSKTPTAYKINNANYFQLRDVAVLLNGTKAQFSIEYDNAAKAIKITTGQPYAPNGKEMKGAKATAEAIVGNNDVYINGVKADFAVYKIGGSNFFQIRDLGKALGFNVDWAKDVGIIIDPSKPYSGK